MKLLINSVSIYLRTSSAKGSQTVVGHVIAGGDVHSGQLGAVPGKRVTCMVCETRAGAKVQLFNVGTVPCKDKQGMVTNSLKE